MERTLSLDGQEDLSICHLGHCWDRETLDECGGGCGRTAYKSTLHHLSPKKHMIVSRRSSCGMRRIRLCRLLYLKSGRVLQYRASTHQCGNRRRLTKMIKKSGRRVCTTLQHDRDRHGRQDLSATFVARKPRHAGRDATVLVQLCDTEL